MNDWRSGVMSLITYVILISSITTAMATNNVLYLLVIPFGLILAVSIGIRNSKIKNEAKVSLLKKTNYNWDL